MGLNWKKENALKIPKTIHKPKTKLFRIAFIGLLVLIDLAITIAESSITRTSYVGYLTGIITGNMFGFLFFILKKHT